MKSWVTSLPSNVSFVSMTRQRPDCPDTYKPLKPLPLALKATSPPSVDTFWPKPENVPPPACERITHGSHRVEGFVITDKNTFRATAFAQEGTAKTIARKAGVDKNIRMVMLEHMNSDKMDSRYGLVDESDLLIAADPLEVFLQRVYQNVGQSQKKWPSNGEPKRYK